MTVTLEVARQLKDAGYPQEGTPFKWCLAGSDGKWYRQYTPALACWPFKDRIAAPTSDEIIERLPAYVEQSGHYKLMIQKWGDNHYTVKYINLLNGDTLAVSTKATLSDAAGLMWCWLKGEGLLK